MASSKRTKSLPRGENQRFHYMVYIPDVKKTGFVRHAVLRLLAGPAIFLLSAGMAWADDSQQNVPAAPASYNVMSARERGGFDIGPATGGVSVTKDEESQREILKFDFQAFPKSHTGVWTKKYPRGLRAPAVDAVKMGVKVPDAELLKAVSVRAQRVDRTQKVVHSLAPGEQTAFLLKIFT